MSIDYDLVIIGNTPEAIYAAATAVNLKSRVAIVEQPSLEHLIHEQAIYYRTLSHIANFHQQIIEDLWDILPEKIADQKSDLTQKLRAVKNWTEIVSLTLKEKQGFASLASIGVDTVKGSGKFHDAADLTFGVNNRQLRSHAYLIATGSYLQIPKIEGIEESGYLTVRDLQQQKHLQSLGDQIVVIGNNYLQIELVQSLARLGKNVTLIVEDERILPKEDPEASLLIQTQLEAEGVNIFTSSPCSQIKLLDGKKWLQAGDRAIEADEIILGGKQRANLAGLNLKEVGVKCGQNNILVNSKLQTTNPQIYACGDVIGGYSYSHIGQYEANIALKNSLFIPIFKVDYSYIPWAIFSEPNLARVGMTEAQAKLRYGDRIYVVKHFFNSVTKAIILEKITGFCKLILKKDGTILGAHIVGFEAAELIGAIALAIKNKIKLTRLLELDFPSVSATFSEIINQTAIEFHQQKLDDNPTLQNLLTSWFNWRRNI